MPCFLTSNSRKKHSTYLPLLLWVLKISITNYALRISPGIINKWSVNNSCSITILLFYYYYCYYVVSVVAIIVIVTTFPLCMFPCYFYYLIGHIFFVLFLLTTSAWATFVLVMKGISVPLSLNCFFLPLCSCSGVLKHFFNFT